ncbi:MAG: Txe/YoeB family addiction module toxin [Thermoanaerobaculia bacterium]|nr:Txe/YoeB family addiction module toxin [Thermoanaerobaculia bacterium]
MKIVFEKGAFEDFTNWATEDKRIFRRIVALIMDVVREPFSGIGKPEPLRHQLQGYWSRRINDEHRLVYKKSGETVIIISCRFHYSK